MILTALLLVGPLPPPAATTPPPPPKIEWIKPGEEIIRDPNGFDPQWKYQKPPSDPKERLKDPFTYA